jgi:hypothetical protein
MQAIHIAAAAHAPLHMGPKSLRYEFSTHHTGSERTPLKAKGLEHRQQLSIRCAACVIWLMQREECICRQLLGCGKFILNVDATLNQQGLYITSSSTMPSQSFNIDQPTNTPHLPVVQLLGTAAAAAMKHTTQHN